MPEVVYGIDARTGDLVVRGVHEVPHEAGAARDHQRTVRLFTRLSLIQARR